MERERAPMNGVLLRREFVEDSLYANDITHTQKDLWQKFFLGRLRVLYLA
jgi:hypothetical protein